MELYHQRNYKLNVDGLEILRDNNIYIYYLDSYTLSEDISEQKARSTSTVTLVSVMYTDEL